MANRHWVFNVEDKRHRVDIEWSRWGTGGKILLDGMLVDIWGGSLMDLPAEKHFEVAGKPAVLRRKGILFESPELYVDGKLIP